MLRLLIRWAVIAIAVAAAAWLVPGIEVTGSNGIVVVFVMAAVLGLINAFVRPILTCCSLPAIALTLGLFLFVVNALAFWLAGYISASWLNLGFQVDGFLAALFGSIVVSVVATVLNMLIPDKVPGS